MTVRIVIFFGLVFGLAGVTASMGMMLGEHAGTCEAYKTC